MRKTIAHFIEDGLKTHQHFIYNQIVHTKKYRSIVIAPLSHGNRREFPFKNFYNMSKINDLRQFFKKQNVIAIHAHHGGHGLTIVPIAAKYKIPLIVSFRGRDASAQKNRFSFNRKRYKKLRNKGTIFLPVCQFLGRELKKLGFPKKKIHPLYGGIDLNLFPFQLRSLPDDEEIRILSVGRLVKKKGFIHLIKAFYKVHQTYPNTKLHIVGEGKMEKRIRALIRKSELSHAVVMKGKQNAKQISKEMQQAHIFCLASQTTKDGDVEGIPNVLKEAMACGLPVVSTKHAGIPELIHHKRTGYLTEENDKDQFAEGLKYWLEHPGDWKQVTTKARQMIEKDFNLKKQIKKQEKLYRLAVR